MTTHTTAFKEWAIVCDALASGKQQLIFRKGGIHEGREGFSFKHDTFALMPTRFHAKAEHVTENLTAEQSIAKPSWQDGDIITITHVALAQWAKTLTSWADVKKLSAHHIYSEQTLSERFHWQGKNMPTGSIHVALVRVYRLAEPLALSYNQSYAGCRSWIDIPEYSTDSMSPVLDDAIFEATCSDIL